MVLTRINNNVSAINANRNLFQVSNRLARSLERLSSGLRINRASDDAAGLSISETQRSQIRGLNRAMANAQDAVGLINTAEGALTETTSRLQRIRELAIQALNSGGTDANATQAIQDEIETSIQEITRIAETTQFSTRVLLNGDNANQVSIRANTPDRGISVAQTTVNSSLPSGTAFLRITQTQVGTEVVGNGTDGRRNANITDITGSTFASGSYTLTVSNVQQAAEQRVLTGTFADANGGGINGTDNLNTVTLNGQTIGAGDVITVQVTLNNGTQASQNFTAGTTTMTTFLNSINTLLSDASSAAPTVAFGAGTSATQFRLSAGFTGASQLGITITIDSNGDSLADFTDVGTVERLGRVNQAVLSLDGGPAQTVTAGSTVTLYGRSTGSSQPTPRATLSFAAGVAFVSEGDDVLNITQAQFTGSLNGGRTVAFAPGDREVLFRTGTAAGAQSGDFLLLNIAENLNLSGTPAVGLQATVILSATSNALRFQIGANEGQDLDIALSNMAADQLGYVGGLNVNGVLYSGTVGSIDVRTQSGAENAVRIVDRALAQVSRQRSYLGATTNRLEATIANLGVASENLTAAESRIRDADIASETTEFVRNQIVTQAATAILAQANLQPRSVLQLLS